MDADVSDDMDGDLRPFGWGYDIGVDEAREAPQRVDLPLVLSLSRAESRGTVACTEPSRSEGLVLR